MSRWRRAQFAMSLEMNSSHNKASQDVFMNLTMACSLGVTLSKHEL